MGPIPNINKTNFEEFFVCPIASFFLFELGRIFLDFFFFMKDIILHNFLKNLNMLLNLKNTFIQPILFSN